MKGVKKLFSKLSMVLKSLLKKFRNIFKPINRCIKTSMSKVINLYKKANSKNKFVEPVFVITASCLLVLVMIISIKRFTTVEEVNITSNAAEYLYYKNEYDKAIEEYKKMQEGSEWPIYTVKIADLYSLQGEKEKSNTLLREALIKRDKVIKEEGYEIYKDKDLELIKSMLFTFTLNKEYGDVVSFGEQYIKEYGQNKDIFKILFTAYIQTNNEYKALELLDTYTLDKKSSQDIASYANMNILINEWDNGIDLLKDAWDIDNNDLNIFNAIRKMYIYDKDSLIDTLKNKINESNEDEYKAFLAAAYSMDKGSVDKAATLIDELEDKKIENINIDIIKQEINNNSNNENKDQKYLEDAIHKSKAINKESYSTYYLLSLKALSDEKYDEALTYAKKSINSNTNNCASYGILIPSILEGKKEFAPIEIYYREAMKKEPFNYEVVINLANYYANYVSNDEKAKEYYNFAINLRKNNSALYKKLADINIKDEKYKDAIENIKDAIKIDDNIQEYYTTLGALYLGEGNYEEGIEVTRKAYSMNDKDVRSLNNAAWYYIVVEKDLLRGFENLKAAYSEMPAGIKSEDKNIIIENYNYIKKSYDKFIAEDSEEVNITGLKLIY